MVSGDRDLRPGHLVHLLIDLERGEETMSLTGSVRRVRDHNDGVGLAIAFPVLSADQEDRDSQCRVARVAATQRRGSAPSALGLRAAAAASVKRSNLKSVASACPCRAWDSLADAVRELENEETEYAGLVIHSVTHDPRSMEVVEFFTRSEDLRTIILPEPDGALCEQAKRLAKLPQVRVPRIWSRSELRRALTS